MKLKRKTGYISRKGMNIVLYEYKFFLIKINV